MIKLNIYLHSEWIKQKVPVTQVHLCHLLDYEQQIVSVVLSHCCYSLKVGEAHTVQYDHHALEKHILDKFVQGKPLIEPNIPQVVFRKDVHTTATFGIIREKVYKQVYVCRVESNIKGCIWLLIKGISYMCSHFVSVCLFHYCELYYTYRKNWNSE